jgi:hypothetical protein
LRKKKFDELVRRKERERSIERRGKEEKVFQHKREKG